ARAVRALADLKFALEDVPDLREIVLVQRMVRAGLVAHEAGIGLGRTLGPWMEEHLAPLAGPAQRLPRPVVDVNGFHWLMTGRHCVAHGFLREECTRVSLLGLPGCRRRRAWS